MIDLKILQYFNWWQKYKVLQITIVILFWLMMMLYMFRLGRWHFSQFKTSWDLPFSMVQILFMLSL